jgi:hypothetical protein
VTRTTTPKGIGKERQEQQKILTRTKTGKSMTEKHKDSKELRKNTSTVVN